MLSRADQLRDAIDRCEIRLRIAERNLKEVDPTNARKIEKLHGDYCRAKEDLGWMQKRLEEALGGSQAFLRQAAE